MISEMQASNIHLTKAIDILAEDIAPPIYDLGFDLFDLANTRALFRNFG